MKKMTLKDMRMRLKKEGIRGYSRMDRETLENAIRLIQEREEAIHNRPIKDEIIWINYNGVYLQGKILQRFPNLKIKTYYGETDVALEFTTNGKLISPTIFNAMKYNTPTLLYTDLDGWGTLQVGEEYYFGTPMLSNPRLGKLNEVKPGANNIRYIFSSGGWTLAGDKCAVKKEDISTQNYDTEVSHKGGVGVEIEVGSSFTIRRNKEYLAKYLTQGYKLCFDGSIGGGYEINSPIMDDDYSMLQQLLLDVKSLGGRPRKTCGIHVHHDATGFDARRLLNVINIYSLFSEKALKYFIPKHRWGNPYCKTYKGSKEAPYIISDLQESIQADITADSCKTYSMAYERYMDVNLRAYYDHNTLEFRQFHATFEYDEVLAWIKLTKAIINLSSNNKKIDNILKKDTCSFYEMCDILKLDLETITTFQKIHQNLAMKGEIV